MTPTRRLVRDSCHTSVSPGVYCSWSTQFTLVLVFVTTTSPVSHLFEILRVPRIHSNYEVKVGVLLGHSSYHSFRRPRFGSRETGNHVSLILKCHTVTSQNLIDPILGGKNLFYFSFEHHTCRHSSNITLVVYTFEGVSV